MMKFWGDGGLWGPEPMAKKGFLKTSLVQKGDFIKARGQNPWAERASRNHKETLVIYLGVGEGRSRGSFQ